MRASEYHEMSIDWYYSDGDSSEGPMSLQALQALYRKSSIQTSGYLWGSHLPEGACWQRISDDPHLLRLFGAHKDERVPRGATRPASESLVKLRQAGKVKLGLATFAQANASIITAALRPRAEPPRRMVPSAPRAEADLVRPSATELARRLATEAREEAVARRGSKAAHQRDEPRSSSHGSTSRAAEYASDVPIASQVSGSGGGADGNQPVLQRKGSSWAKKLAARHQATKAKAMCPPVGERSGADAVRSDSTCSEFGVMVHPSASGRNRQMSRGG